MEDRLAARRILHVIRSISQAFPEDDLDPGHGGPQGDAGRVLGADPGEGGHGGLRGSLASHIKDHHFMRMPCGNSSTQEVLALLEHSKEGNSCARSLVVKMVRALTAE